MGRQWLHAKRAVVNNRKGQMVGKLVKEVSVAAKLGGPDPTANARLFAALEKARKASVTKDVIERAVKKGAGLGGEKMVMDHIVFEGYAPHKVPVIVEIYTDNVQRTTPEVSVLFKQGVLGLAGSNNLAAVVDQTIYFPDMSTLEADLIDIDLWCIVWTKDKAFDAGATAVGGQGCPGIAVGRHGHSGHAQFLRHGYGERDSPRFERTGRQAAIVLDHDTGHAQLTLQIRGLQDRCHHLAQSNDVVILAHG